MMARPHEIRLASLVALLLYLLLPLGALDAQEDTFSGTPEGVRSRTPVTVALVDRIEDSRTGALVRRRAETYPKDLILLRRNGASPSRLSAALFTYLVARDVLGATVASDETIPVLRRVGPRAWRGKTLPRLNRLLRKLRETEPAMLRGVGEVPSITVWVPAHYNTGVDGAAL